MSTAAHFEYAFARTLGVEKGYVNDPNDRGGETKYGISKRAFPHIDIKNLTLPQAKRLAYDHYWCPVHLDAIRDKYVAAEVFDSCYLHGPGAAGRIAQRACNFLGESLAVDGIIGRKTADALNRLSARYRLSLLVALNLWQGVYFIEIIKNDPSQEANARGWMKRLTVPAEVLEE